MQFGHLKRQAKNSLLPEKLNRRYLLWKTNDGLVVSGQGEPTGYLSPKMFSNIFEGKIIIK